MTDTTPPQRSDDPVTELGHAWAEELRAALHREGRSATGGWPGTMREARRRCAAYGALGVGGQDPEGFARAMNAAARRHWLVLRDRPEPTEAG